MAQGRMLKKKISASESIAAMESDLGPVAVLVWVLMLPHTDRDGRLPGNLTMLKSTIAPMLSSVTTEIINQTLNWLAGCGMIHWYKENNKTCIEIDGFADHQKIHYKREAPSDYPARTDLSENVFCGNPGQVRMRSRAGPDEVRTCEPKIEAERDSGNQEAVITNTVAGLRINPDEVRMRSRAGLDEVPGRSRIKESKVKESKVKKRKNNTVELKKTNSDVELVLGHYRKYHPRSHPQTRPDSKSVRLVVSRLSDGYSAKDLTDAIDGCHASAWHQGENDRHRKFDSLELILRDGTKVQQFIELGARLPVEGLSAKSIRSGQAAKLFIEDDRI